MRALVLSCLLLGAPVVGRALPAAGAAGIELRAASVPGELQAQMLGWHDRYRPLISPVLREWRQVARAARSGQTPESLVAGCRRLDRALAGLDRRRLLSAPDPAVSIHLGESLRSLAEAARGCTRGAYFLTDWRLRQAAGSWSELRHRLVLYGLTP